MLIGRRLEQNLMNSHWLSCCSFLKCAKGWTSSTGNQYVCIWSWIELYPKIKAAREKLEMPCFFFKSLSRQIPSRPHKAKGFGFFLGSTYFSASLAAMMLTWCALTIKRNSLRFWLEREQHKNSTRNPRVYHIPVKGNSSSFLEALAEVLSMCVF